MAAKAKITKVKKLVSELLDLIGLKSEMEIEEKEAGVLINLKPENPAILIGYHGEALSSLQLILNLMVYRNLGEWLRITVNVGDYRERRQKTLEQMAGAASQRVKFSKTEFELPPMSAGERRVIHLFLANDPEVATESKGEGRERRVVVKPKVG